MTVWRIFLLFPAALLLCQCSTTKRSMALVVYPGTTDPVAFALKSRAGTEARRSEFMAGMENAAEQFQKDKTLLRELDAITGVAPNANKAYMLGIGGPISMVQTTRNTPLAVVLPAVTFETKEITDEAINRAMPRLQAYAFGLLAKHFSVVRQSEILIKNPKP